MGIVDHHRKRLAAIYFFKSPGYLLELSDGFSNLLERASTSKSRSSGSQNVIDVDPADQRRLNLYAACRRDQIKFSAVLLQVDICRFEVAILDSIEDDFLVERFAALAQALAVFVIGVDHGSAWRTCSTAQKQNALGFKVAVHALVVIQMVAREVGEDRHFIRHTPDAFLRQRV